MNSGTLLSILGKSGSGKTTLLKCIYGLEDLEKGSIFIEEEQVWGPSRQLIPGHKRMKLVSQDFYVLDNHTVEENFLDQLAGYNNDYKKKRSEELLLLLELKKFRDKKPVQLSAGQRQRVSIGRALADFPEVLLLDEPFTNLDALLKDRIFTFIRQQLSINKGICVMVTHHSGDALRYSSQIAILEEGKVIQQDSPENSYHKPGNLKIARLFGKCYELKKEEFLSKKNLKFKEGKIWLRPEQLKISGTKQERHIEVELVEQLFALDKYELMLKTKNGTLLSCYHYGEKLDSEKCRFLTVLNRRA